MNISHSDCICPAGASTWDEAVYLNLSTLQEPSIRPLTHTRRRSERPTRVSLVRSFTLQHSHPFWVSVLRLYSSVCFHCVKLFNVTSKHNSLCILRLKWNTLVVEKLRCCYGFTCTTKHFMIDSTTQCAGRRGTCDSSDLKLIHLNPSSQYRNTPGNLLIWRFTTRSRRENLATYVSAKTDVETTLCLFSGYV